MRLYVSNSQGETAWRLRPCWKRFGQTTPVRQVQKTNKQMNAPKKPARLDNTHDTTNHLPVTPAAGNAVSSVPSAGVSRGRGGIPVSHPCPATRRADLEIIDGIYTKGYLTTTQIHQIFFPESKVQKVCEQRMLILKKRGFVRSIEQAVVSGQGRLPFLWAISEGGKAVLVKERGIDPAAINTTPLIDENHNIFIKHCLAITDIQIALLKACSLYGFTLEEFINDANCAPHI